MMKRLLVCCCILHGLLLLTLAHAAEPTEITLWPKGVPGAEKYTGEKEEIWQERGTPEQKNRSVRNVQNPSLTAYLPPAEKATGTAVVICPGGGYGGLAIDKEGHDVARWLNSFGVAGFVLKYRLPKPPEPIIGHRAPLMDAQQAIRIVRSRAAEFALNPDHIGIMGFSAGGHLAATASTHFTNNPSGDAKQTSDRPDFSILIYPVISLDPEIYHSGSSRNLIGENPPQDLIDLYSNEKQVTPQTPPAFLISTLDDGVKCQNSIAYALAMKNAKVPAELHLYPSGGHGYGLIKSSHNVSTWPERCKDWMVNQKIITTTK